ncbi:DNA primase large subunit-like [Crassostrea angulata]|uniref:DNA primase large subunit-like n=1 Tax=Magallana angulata TaxID=2784310 RepID=UPI0022B0D9DB|nr:DNA primase large subunit-like [Crassostrea angulata]
MLIGSRTKRPKNSKLIKSGAEHRLQIYKVPPKDTVTLQEFEEYAVERLKVLKAIENAGIRHIRGSEDYNHLVEKEVKKTKLAKIIRTDYSTDCEEFSIDHISHFILRLAYCRSEDLKRWFLQQELDLFRFRFLKENAEDKQKFLKVNSLDYNPISEDEKQRVLQDLMASAGRNSTTADTNEYFKVPFTEVLDLVRGRKVFLSRGFAYVPKDDMISILITHYRAHLSQQLAMTSRALPQLEEDNRLLPMLSGLSKRYLGQDYSSKKSNVGKITAEMIDSLSKQSFPPCMQNLHQSMKRDHHLKHGGRMQYGLFLKGIGLSLEEALRFWRTEFTKAMDGDKFDKQYSYNIRHNYGKEGKRADYTPYSCNKIIMSNAPGPGDNHGCPFRHTDADLLAQKLRLQGISKDFTDKIMKYTRDGHYQIACKYYFDATHSGVEEPDVNINHPNQYFDESQHFYSGKKEAKLPNTPARTGSQRSSQNTPRSQLSQNSQPTSQNTTVDDEMMDDDLCMAAMETA